MHEGDVVKFSEQGILYCISETWVQKRVDRFKLHIDAMRAIAAVRFQVTAPLLGIESSPTAYVCSLIADPHGWYQGYHVGESVGAWSRKYLTCELCVATQTRRLTVKAVTPMGGMYD